MAKRVKVKFGKVWNSYIKGDEAGFSEDVAKSLEKAGIAKIVGGVKEPAAKTKEPAGQPPAQGGN